jgi:hypothetical protein
MAWTAPITWTTGQTVTAAQMNANVRDNINAIAPVGLYVYLHRTPTRVETTINGAFLECNGTAVSRTTYSALFGVVSTVYGSGNGSSTFNLPDFAGRSPVGAAGTGGHADVTALGANEGAALASRRQKHAHSGGSAAGSAAGLASSSTTGATVGLASAPVDTGAYLVAGVWAIKY